MALCRTNSRCSSEHFSIEKSILVGPPLKTTWSPYFRNHMTHPVIWTIKHVPGHQILSTLSLSPSLHRSKCGNFKCTSHSSHCAAWHQGTKKNGPTSELNQKEFPILDARLALNNWNPEILTTESNQPKTPQTIRNLFWMPTWSFWIGNPKSRNLNPESPQVMEISPMPFN